MKIFLSHSKLERYFFLCGYIIFFNAPSCQIVAEHFPSCILLYFKKKYILFRWILYYYLLNIRTNHTLFCLFFMDENAGFFMRIISLWIYWILILRAKSCKTPPNWKWIINKFLGWFKFTFMWSQNCYWICTWFSSIMITLNYYTSIHIIYRTTYYNFGKQRIVYWGR